MNKQTITLAVVGAIIGAVVAGSASPSSAVRVAAVITVAGITRELQLALASWVLRLRQPPLGRVTTGRGTDPTDRDMDIRNRDTDTLSRATTATPIRIAAAITIHTEDTALSAPTQSA